MEEIMSDVIANAGITYSHHASFDNVFDFMENTASNHGRWAEFNSILWSVTEVQSRRGLAAIGREARGIDF
jgi:hypothetical protein